MKELNLFKLIVIVFLISWLGVLPSLLTSYGFEIPKAFSFLEIFMSLGPILGATAFIYQKNGKYGLKTFFKRLMLFKANWSTLLIAIASPIIISLLASTIGLRIFNIDWPKSFTSANIISNGLFIFMVYIFINTEELMWRGIVFDKFLNKYGFFKACLYLIPIWWLFHIPLFLYKNGHPAGYGILEFSFIVIAQTFILGWIYINTKRSLAYVHMYHQLINGFGQAFPIFPIFVAGNFAPLWIFIILMLLMAIALIVLQLKYYKLK